MDIISRAEAKAQGLKHYFTGSPCKHGHIAERYTRNSICIWCARLYVHKNRDHLNKRERERYFENIDERRRYNRERMRKHLPSPTRPEPDVCECCENKSTGRYTSLHLDHDHTTNKFRGWLCNNCNAAIGKLGDSIAGLQRAINYLKRAEQQQEERIAA